MSEQIDRTSYKDIGCMNSWWPNAPAEYVACQNEGKHRLVEINLGRCYNRYCCDACKICWSVDSSD